MEDIEKLRKLMDVANIKFRVYESDVRFHAGWEDEKNYTDKSFFEFASSVEKLASALLPTPSNNAVAVGDLHIYAPVAIEDIESLLSSANLPCDKSKQN